MSRMHVETFNGAHSFIIIWSFTKREFSQGSIFHGFHLLILKSNKNPLTLKTYYLNMVAAKMTQAKLTCMECDCWSLPYDARKAMRRYEIYAKQIKPNVNTPIYTKWIEAKTNQNIRNSRN